MSEVQTALEGCVAGLAEMTNADLADLVHLLERTYIHALIEIQLRGASR